MPPAPPHGASSLATLLLRKCSATTSVRRARQLHALLLTYMPTPPETPFLYNNILSMYARCASLHDVQLLFDKMPHRNIVSYNALISAYSRSPHHANWPFHLFNQLKNDGLAPNEYTMISLLSAGFGNRVIGSSLHGQCMKIGLLINVRIETSLIAMYSSCGDVDCANRSFSPKMNKDSMAWNTIISGHVKNGRTTESLYLFRSMLRDGINPTEFTYSSVLNACAKLEDYGSGKILHAQVFVSGIHIDLPLQNALLDMYCSCGDTQTAFHIFLRTKKRDLVSWNSMIGGFSEKGDGEIAMNLFIQLIQESNAKPDEYTFAAVILGTAAFPSCQYGKPLHAQIEKTGFTRSKYIGSTLISMYFNNDDSVSSQKIFASFLHKDAILWTDMIAGLVRIGESEAAIKIYHDMLLNSCNVDSFTLSSALSACADLATLRQGEMIHSLAVKTGNDTETCVHGSLVDMYAKNGELKSAAYIFSCFDKCDLKCWNSMLAGYGHHGEAEVAFQIFDEMVKNGVKPDHVTFLSLLSACSHCGLVEKSKFYWKYMKANGLSPGPKHYSCMISVLSRAGLLEEAEEMLMESPFVDDYLELSRTILSSCVKNGNLRVGLRAAERILKLNEEDGAANVLIAKLYALAGKWDEVSEIRRKMRRLMVDKDPGLSWIEVRDSFHVFCSGDQSHLQYKEVEIELSKLLGNLIHTVIVDDIIT